MAGGKIQEQRSILDESSREKWMGKEVGMGKGDSGLDVGVRCLPGQAGVEVSCVGESAVWSGGCRDLPMGRTALGS